MQRKFQPIVHDAGGCLRKRLNVLHRQTKIPKSLIIAKALELGFAQLGANPSIEVNNQ